MANITLLPSAKVPLVYDGENTMTTEWYRFFWNIYGFTGTGVIPVDKGGTGLDTIGDHQLIIGNANNVFEPALLSSASIAITYPAGFINLELGTSGVTPGTYGSASTVGVFTVNAYGVLTAASNTSIGIDASQIISGTLPVIRGGTGQSTYTDGQLLIGNSTGNTLTKTTLTASTGISVTNGAGSITLANTGVLSVSGTAPVVSSGGATPAISMAAANTTTNGYLTSTDWNTFNNKAPATSGTSILYGNGSGGFSNVTIGSGISFAGGTLSATGTGGTVTSVSGTGTVNGITLTGTVTSSGSLTLGGTLSGIGNSQLTNSTISGVALGGNLFNLTAGTGVSFSSGTTYNGSAAITINATGTGGTVTSVAALTLGTTGTDLSSTVANGTTTPVITLNVPTASASNRGALSAADWTTFNNKAPGVTFTTGYVPFGQGTTTLNQDSALFWDNTNKRLGVGTTSPTQPLNVEVAVGNGISLGNRTFASSGVKYFGLTGGGALGGNSSYFGFSNNGVSAGSDIIYQAFFDGVAAGGNHIFRTASATIRMQLFASGGLSLGNTTDPGATNLSVTGTGKFGTTVGVGAATPSTSGAGITFPATQSASTNANTLDDYEEGSWIPSVGGTATYTLQDGRYVKVGQIVFCTGKLVINVLGTGSASTISGLPFTQQSTSNGVTGTGAASFWNNFNVNAISVTINVVNNSTTFYTVITNAAGTGVTYNQPNFMKDGTRIDFSFTYIASA